MHGFKDLRSQEMAKGPQIPQGAAELRLAATTSLGTFCLSAAGKRDMCPSFS